MYRLILALLLLAVPASAQIAVPSMTSRSTESATPPTNPENGQMWTDTDDDITYYYNVADVEWQSIAFDVLASSGAANVEDAIFFASQAVCDTTRATPSGYYFGARVRLLGIKALTPDAAVDSRVDLFASGVGAAPRALGPWTFDNPWETSLTVAAGDTLQANEVLAVYLENSAANPPADPIIIMKFHYRHAPA